jgi:OmpA-OmpF porin, OOP family
VRMFIEKSVLVWICATVWAPMLLAQSTPSPEQMVEQLKAPRTRSLRNLTVEAAPPQPSASAAPTASVSATPVHNVSPAAQAPLPTSAAITSLATPAPIATAPAAALPPAVSAPSAQPNAPEARPALSLLIQFDFNSARIKPESQQALANLAVALKSAELLGSQFAIEGHTDAKGRADYNLRLSQQRADAVLSSLVAQGIAAPRLRSTGKGASELANSGDPGAAENRRVRIVNLD